MDGETFQVELARLIRWAEANGVDVEGGWACDGDESLTEWGIEIYEVAPPDEPIEGGATDS